MDEHQEQTTGRSQPTELATPPPLARVLVVDDDPDFSLLVTDALEETGLYEVSVAPDARRARELPFASYEAIILDFNLPDATGLDLLAEIARSCGTPVVMLTGENVVGTAVKAVRAGAFGYLVKSADNLAVLPGIVGQAVDEAQRRRDHLRAQVQMRRAENLAGLGTLSAGMCHEMNNPLAAVLGFADLYLHGIETDARLCMEAIREAGCRLRDVVRSLASFASGIDAPRQDADVGALVAGELAGQAQNLADAGVEVAFDPPREPARAPVDAPALGQVIQHLVGNACQAMEASAKKILTVRVSAAEGPVRIEVEDTGHGVPQEIRDRIFDPFFTTRDPNKGMGMGLAISHRIVDGHGGRIWFEPASAGGARFVVELPAGVQTNGDAGSATVGPEGGARGPGHES